MISLTDFDPFSAEVVADPYGWYERIAKDGPVHWLPSRHMWMVTGYDQVTQVLREPTVYSSGIGYAALAEGALNRDQVSTSGVFGVDTSALRMLISTDPPDHTRIRRLLSRAFTPKAIAVLEPRLREICSLLVAEAIAGSAGGESDLVTDLSIRFPITVIAELLDIPIARRDDFRRWSDAMSGVLSGDTGLEEAQAAGAELFVFMAEMVERRRSEPGDDLISRLVLGNPQDEADDPDALATDEIIMICVLLLIAGNETTTNLVSNLAAALTAHPEQMARVWADKTLLPAVIEEVLRWDSPVQGMLRGTTEATSLGEVALPANSLVLTCLAAANRDPSHYRDPDRFDIDRRANDHVAFGNGIHFCLGASLARLETRMVFESFIETGVGLRPLAGAERTANFMLRGFSKFPVAYTQTARA